MVTLQDIAREAGFGLGTVSRALSGRGKVAGATREKVLAAAAQLGYVPNAAARALAGQRTGNGTQAQILVAYLRAQPLHDAWFQKACREQGLMGVCVTDTQFGSPEAAARELHARGVDAILLNPRGLTWTASDLQRFAWDRFTVVILGRLEGLPGYELVRHSAFDYMRTALGGLRDFGFRRIRVILHRSISPADDDARVGAVLAFQRAVAPAGVTVHLETLPTDLNQLHIPTLTRLLQKKNHDAVLLDHFGFVGKLLDHGPLLEALPYAAAITADREDPYFGEVSGCPVNNPALYERALHAVFEKVQLGIKGRPAHPIEHVIEPHWESRSSLTPGA